MKFIFSIFLILLIGLAPQRLEAKRKKGIDKALSGAWNIRNKEPDTALKTTQEVLNGIYGEITKKQEIKAYDLQYESYRKKHQWDKAIEVLDVQLKQYPKDKEVVRKIIFRKVDCYRRKRQNYDKAVKELNEFVKANQAERELCAEVLLRSCDFLRDSKKYPEYYATAQKALKLAQGNLQLEINALWQMQEAAGRMKNEEKRAQAFLDSLKPKYREFLRSNDVEYRISLYADSLMRMKRYSQARDFLKKEIPNCQNQEPAQQWAMKIANSLYDEKKYPEAFVAYEKVITEHPNVTREWRGAQNRRVECLMNQKKFKEALQEQRIVFDDSNHEGDVRWAIERFGHLFWEIDKNNDRTDELYKFQVYGPAGEDKKPGTADDLKNPILKIPYPKNSNRRKILSKVIAESGDSSEEARLRGMRFLYMGQPKAAALHFLDALKRYTGKEFNKPVIDLVLKGIRGIKGDSHSVPNATNFIIYGPAGKDGQKGTADDAKNPFKGLGLPSTKSLPSASKENKAKLTKLWQELVRVAGNPKEERNRRKICIKALRRIYETAAVDSKLMLADTTKMMDQAHTKDRQIHGELMLLAMAGKRQYQISLQPLINFQSDIQVALSKSGEKMDPKIAGDIKKSVDRSLSYIKKSTAPPKLRLPKPKKQKKKKPRKKKK